MTSGTIFHLWPIAPFGCEEDNANQNDGNGEQSNSSGNIQGSQRNSGQGSSSSAGGDSGSKATNDDDDDDPYKGLSARELKRLLKDAEDGKTKSDTELQQLRDAQEAAARKEKSELENAQADLKKRDETISTLRSSLARQAIIGAIRDDKRFDWHNPEVVAQQFNSGEVTVDDEGKVTGLAKALTRIAKDESLKFLLAKDNTQQQDSKQNQQQQNNGPTGFQPGQGGTSSSGGNQMPDNIDELVKTMPALRSRIGASQ